MGLERDREEDVPRAQRAPYEPPAILWDEALGEQPGLVMACSKVVDGQSGCGALALLSS